MPKLSKDAKEYFLKMARKWQGLDREKEENQEQEKKGEDQTC